MPGRVTVDISGGGTKAAVIAAINGAAAGVGVVDSGLPGIQLVATATVAGVASNVAWTKDGTLTQVTTTGLSGGVDAQNGGGSGAGAGQVVLRAPSIVNAGTISARGGAGGNGTGAGAGGGAGGGGGRVATEGAYSGTDPVVTGGALGTAGAGGTNGAAGAAGSWVRLA